MFKKLNLYSKTEMKILNFVISKDGEHYSEEIAKGAKVSAASASTALKTFSKSGLVLVSTKGRMVFYKRNDQNIRTRQYKISQTLGYLEEVISKIKPLSQKIILFGSCAEGKNTEQSDIDLFVLSSEHARIVQMLHSYPKISAIILNSSEYTMLMEKDKPLYERINKGIELWE